MSREQLVRIARRGVEHNKAGTQDQMPGILEVPVGNYFEPERWKREMDRVFGRVPLVVGASSEFTEAGAYRSLWIGDTPILISRGDDGELRAFVNMCSHRGAVVTEEGEGVTRRHSCPYHAWVYDTKGDLVGVLDAGALRVVDPRVIRAGVPTRAPFVS